MDAVWHIATKMINDAIGLGTVVDTGYGIYQRAACAPTCFVPTQQGSEHITGLEDDTFEIMIGIWLESLRGGLAAKPCSFAGDTEVLTADGTTKPISDVDVGDLVWAIDPETGNRVHAKS